MKQIVKKKEETQLTVDELLGGLQENDLGECYIGVVLHYGSKGFVTREKFKSGKFVVRSAKNLSNGNGWSFLSNTNPKDFLNGILEEGCKIFTFKSGQELFNWIFQD